jgi:hypothetical protein
MRLGGGRVVSATHTYLSECPRVSDVLIRSPTGVLLGTPIGSIAE